MKKTSLQSSGKRYTKNLCNSLPGRLKDGVVTRRLQGLARLGVFLVDGPILPGVVWSKCVVCTYDTLRPLRTAQSGSNMSITRTDDRFLIHGLDLPGRVGIFPILYDLPCVIYVAHVAGWKQYDLHDLAHSISWVGSVLYRSCTTSHSGRWGTRSSRSSRSWSVLYRCCAHCPSTINHLPEEYRRYKNDHLPPEEAVSAANVCMVWSRISPSPRPILE